MSLLKSAQKRFIKKGMAEMRVLLGILFTSLLTFSAVAQELPFRKELKRADLTGTSMEVITSIVEIKPNDVSALHIHHGEECFTSLKVGQLNFQTESKCLSRQVSRLSMYVTYHTALSKSSRRESCKTSDCSYRRQR